ncbi:hypothetical protein [Streptomyces sp. NPDC006193]|uniref:hypothetical protein n=1 Tax=Streptomyces sp. NPDC006193 TaxID=3155717 RepID=UPI0033BB2F7E
MTTKPEPHEPGRLLYDPATGEVGEYRDAAGPYLLLRPLGGGPEWEADPELCRPASDRERLDASVRAVNRRTRAVPMPLPGDAVRPPRPVPGCAVCLRLAERREAARAAYDRSAETDADVLLRRHHGKEHRA